MLRRMPVIENKTVQAIANNKSVLSEGDELNIIFFRYLYRILFS